MKLKKGDQVLILKGKDKGRKGKIIKALPKNRQIIIEGLNLQKKHVRARKEGEKGEVVEVPIPLSVSNIKLVCPRCKKLTRTGYKIVNGKKYRFCKRCKKEFL
jgi:large subunit ribosomal protein L24